MTNKNTFAKVVAAVSVAAVLLIAASLVIVYAVNKKPRAAFYGISESTRLEIVKNLQKTATRKNGKEPYAVIVLDDTVSLEQSLRKSKKIDILFINDGLNAKKAYETVQKKDLGFVKAESLNGISTSIKNSVPEYRDRFFKNTVKKNPGQEEAVVLAEKNRLHTKVCAVPILSDHYEINVKYDFFEKSSVGSVKSISDLEKIAEFTREKVSAPVIFAAADDTELINVYGALTEALSGKDAWKAAAAQIQNLSVSEKGQKEFSELAEKLTREGGEFYMANEILKKWNENRFFPRNIAQISKRDVRAYVSSGGNAILFLTLEEHRSYEKNVIGEYSSIYYPSQTAGAYRHFTAPVIMAVPLSRNEISRASIIRLSGEFQKNLTFDTGLAPVRTQAAVPDRQADDARYWIAASETPFPAMSDAAFLNAAQKSAFAESLRRNLRLF